MTSAADALRLALGCALFAAPVVTAAEPATLPSTAGDSGLIAMPDARVAPDGTFRLGAMHSSPYGGLFGSATIFPAVEFALIFQKLDGVEPPSLDEYGAYKDKQFHIKWNVLAESEYLPAIAVGTRDFLGTRLFPASYLVASKRLGDLDLTLGYGKDRIDGAFGGLRYRPAWAGGFSAVVERDANDYANDYEADQSGADLRTSRVNYGLEYQGAGWGAQLTQEGGEVGGKVWMSMPFGEPDLTPKTKEPPPRFQAPSPPAPRAAWTPRSDPAMTLAAQLYDQDFDKIEIALVGDRLDLRLTNTRISLIGRAVGRAARTVLLFGPEGMKSLHITYTRQDLPVATYEFRDLDLLRAYFGGKATAAQLGPTLTVRYARADQADDARTTALVYSLDELPVPQESVTKVTAGEDAAGNVLFVERSNRAGATYGVKPLVVSGFFNDTGGAFRYDVFAAGFWSQRFAPGLYGNAIARLTLAENVSEVDSGSDSLLPHVRSDVALYKQQGEVLRLDSMYLVKFDQIGERLYARTSIGYYEEMYFGAGGQVMWLPARGPWAFDTTVEYAHQRDYAGGLGLLDYHTVTAIASAHYRIPRHGITATLRGGVFLARDEGFRFEVRRRLRSGLSFGFWYTITNGDDVTGPGSPGDPYYDKGVFLSLPFRLGLPYDSQNAAAFSLAPWARDVGQMVRSPGDLYSMFENTLLLNTTDYNPLSQFGR